MATKLIELEDGILIEVAVSSEDVQTISKRLADKVDKTFEKIRPILMKVCRPIAEIWREGDRETEMKGADVERAEVELGLSFENEGNLYITKSKVNANLTIKLILRPSFEHRKGSDGTD